MPINETPDNDALRAMLAGKSAATLALFDHFVAEFGKIGKVVLFPAKTMIAVANTQKKMAYVTQLGKNFVHVVFPFEKPYNDNLCFQKIAQVPGDQHQFNHHFRMYHPDDVNEEVKTYMRLAFAGEKA